MRAPDPEKPKPRLRLETSDVLQYRNPGAARSTVRRHYKKWRAENGLPAERCDNRDCHFYLHPLEWNGEPLRPILDHRNGVNRDNRPQNLRFLCPNCNSQLETHGGGNKGKVEMAPGGFARIDDDGLRHHVLPAEPGHVRISEQSGSNDD